MEQKVPGSLAQPAPSALRPREPAPGLAGLSLRGLGVGPGAAQVRVGRRHQVAPRTTWGDAGSRAPRTARRWDPLRAVRTLPPAGWD